ncbi:unnamed protein product [Lactuca virosa]|uniref:DUF4817 domain-containing protein n=1 Tax=Lactuca virosa TaxID=75947 RepID=A0AAU9MJM2_9ASTR|nr:unnamed protein product [Lactuca virosa]
MNPQRSNLQKIVVYLSGSSPCTQHTRQHNINFRQKYTTTDSVSTVYRPTNGSHFQLILDEIAVSFVNSKYCCCEFKRKS